MNLSLLAVKTKAPLLQSDWEHQRPAFSGWKGLWNRFVLWQHNRIVHKRFAIYNEGFENGYQAGYSLGKAHGHETGGLEASSLLNDTGAQHYSQYTKPISSLSQLDKEYWDAKHKA